MTRKTLFPQISSRLRACLAEALMQVQHRPCSSRPVLASEWT